MNEKAEKINDEMSVILESFLAHEPLQSTFKDMAVALGYKGDDPVEIKQILFTVSKDRQIGFVLSELNDMFKDFMVESILLSKEPYAKILADFPDRRADAIQIGKLVLSKEPVPEKLMQKFLKDVN